MRLKIAVLSVLACLCFLARTLHAQTAYGRILGTITDASGAVVANANVTVTNTGTNVSVKATSNAQGDYDVPNLIPGNYQVTVEVAGFKKFVASNLVLVVDQKLRVDATLEPGASLL